jgi:hypothetical protein
MSEWTDRMIRGPIAEFLTAEEFGRLFGVGDTYIRDLAKSGVIPAPVKQGKKELWPWEAVVYYGLRLKMVFSGGDSGDVSKEKS